MAAATGASRPARRCPMARWSMRWPQDAAGNTSGPASTTVDSVAPAAPVIDPSNGQRDRRYAEAGATVILTDGGGNPIGQATADGSGNWSFTPGTPLANGTVINAVAQDPAGNTSGPTSTTVDAVAPGHPGGQPEQRQRDRRYRGSRRHGDPHRRRRQPDRPGHCRWQRQLELHPGHTAGQRLGGQCGGPGRAPATPAAGQHHGGLGSPGPPRCSIRATVR
ncbi:Surface adhesion protein, putative [Pseudomonas aeruginosa]|nr:Surface adhesion protein, putative [Pseudomonas aeruginosa]